jgi:hypothetical protein
MSFSGWKGDERMEIVPKFLCAVASLPTVATRNDFMPGYFDL